MTAMQRKLPEFNIEHLNFLVVDGDEYMRGTVSDILRSFGVQGIQEAEQGASALKALETSNPDIILTEWEMPEVSGVELTSTIRCDEMSPHRMTPIVILSAHTQVQHVTVARDAGITEYLAKPITPQTLYSRICSVIVNPRPFIESDGFVGPDRRRKRDPFLVGQARREEDKFEGDEDLGGGAVNEDEIDAMLGL